MAGHSKWKQIKHYKAAADAKRGALFTKLIREITMAAKIGGGDATGNPRLRLAIDTARANSMPKENIERAVKKGTGELEGVDYQEVTYEGYGPGGVALLIDAVTDNPTRTVAEVRSKMSRLGGNLGTPNSVAWMFEKKGQIYVDAQTIDEDSLMEKALARLIGAPARRFLRMKRSVSLLVSDREIPERGTIADGTYQSPILVQWRNAVGRQRLIDVTLTRLA